MDKIKRILVTSTDVMMLQFLVPHIFSLQENGYYVEVACSEVEGHIEELKQIFSNKVKMNVIELYRSPYNRHNLSGFKQLRSIIKEGNFDIVWTNEPVMGVFTRLAAKDIRKKGSKVLYIAHGFHFYKGAPKKNWVVFYPIEKIMSHITDSIITINNEDYQFAKTHFKTRVMYFPGIGVNTGKFKKRIVDKQAKCLELGIPSDKRIIISVGELEKRKNHLTTIEAFNKADLTNSILIICGVGSQKQILRDKISELNCEDKVFLLGYRYDIAELLSMSDIFVFTTFQEGLSVALMEAMANDITCVVSKIRGNVDLIEEGKGIYCNPHSVESCVEALKRAFSGVITQLEKDYNKERIKKFDFVNVNKMLIETIGSL